MSLTPRLIRIRWTGFANTGHWLRGNALTDYLLREHYMEHMRLALNDPSPLLHAIHLDAHNRFRGEA